MTVETMHKPAWIIPATNMTALERRAGRFFRGPDHPDSNGGIDTDDGEDMSGNQSRDRTGDQDGGDAEDDQDADGSPSEGSGDDDEKDDKRSRPNGYEKRISTLTRRLREAEEALRTNNGTKRGDPPKTQDAPKGDVKPKLDDFDTYEDFIEALADFRADQRIKASKDAENADRAGKEFGKRMSAGMKKIADYDDVVTDDVQISKSAVAAIKETDDPAGVIYYLAKHSDELDAINDMAPGRQAIAIGKIEAKLEKGDKSDKGDGKSNEGGSRTKSAAPEPINPTKGGKGALESDYDKMSADDFIRARNAEVRKGYVKR